MGKNALIPDLKIQLHNYWELAEFLSGDAPQQHSYMSSFLSKNPIFERPTTSTVLAPNFYFWTPVAAFIKTPVAAESAQVFFHDCLA